MNEKPRSDRRRSLPNAGSLFCVFAVFAVAVSGVIIGCRAYSQRSRVEYFQRRGAEVTLAPGKPAWLYNSAVALLNDEMAHGFATVKAIEFYGESPTDDDYLLLASFRELEVIHVDETIEQRGLTDIGIESLSGLEGLKELYLSYSSVTDSGLRHLSNLEKLTDLRLEYTGITDAGMQHLRGLQNLEWLALDNGQIDGRGIQQLNGLRNLRYLSINATNVGDDDMVHLRPLESLRFLDLSNTNVTDAGLRHLNNMRGIRHLYLRNTDVTDSGVEWLQSQHSGLEIVR